MSLHCLQKSMGDEADFLPGDKNNSFLQFDSITLGVHRQAYPKYPKQQVYNMSLQYLKENVKDEVDFLPADKRQGFLQNAAIILYVCDQACLNYPK